MPVRPAVRATGLVKRFGALTAVDGLDLVLERGTCLALLGPNGAGKTTTIEMLEGLQRPDAGEIEILGRAWASDPDGIRERIGVQLQETRLTEKVTVHETLRLFRSFYREGRDLAEVLDVVGLTDKRNARVETLSGGQHQRLSLACALVSRPELLFLDEPTTGLDPQARLQLWDIVDSYKRERGTVLLTTHYMEEASRLCDRVAIVDHGKIIARGTSAQLKAFFDRTFCYYAASYPGSAAVIEGMKGKRIGLVLSSEETFPMVSGGIISQIQEYSRYTHSTFVGVVHGIENSRGDVALDPCDPLADTRLVGRASPTTIARVALVLCLGEHIIPQRSFVHEAWSDGLQGIELTKLFGISGFTNFQLILGKRSNAHGACHVLP